MTVLYLAGPMRGKPNHNREEFFDKAYQLERAGYGVVNPAALDAEHEPSSWHDAMRRDVRHLMYCDALAYLDGWEHSDGACIEVSLAQALEMETAHWTEWPPAPDLPPIIGFSGYGRTGKDTAAEVVAENCGFEHRAFADPMKRVALKLLRVSRPNTATFIEGHGWERAKEDIPWLRDYLQHLGTDAMRAEDEDVWVRMALDQPTEQNGIVISDVRFPNEMRAIQERGGVVYRIYRPGYGPANDHESEVALNDHCDEMDGFIWNNGERDGFQEVVLSLFENRYINHVESCCESDLAQHLNHEPEFSQYPNAHTLSFDEVQQ